MAPKASKEMHLTPTKEIPFRVWREEESGFFKLVVFDKADRTKPIAIAWSTAAGCGFLPPSGETPEILGTLSIEATLDRFSPPAEPLATFDPMWKNVTGKASKELLRSLE